MPHFAHMCQITSKCGNATLGFTRTFQMSADCMALENWERYIVIVSLKIIEHDVLNWYTVLDLESPTPDSPFQNLTRINSEAYIDYILECLTFY